MNSLLVTRVVPFSEGSESADVTLSSGRGEITVFCYPCSLKAGAVVPNRLSSMGGSARAAYLSDWPDELKEEHSKERLESVGPFAYRGCGQVIDQAAGLIEVCGFVIELDEVPSGGVVEFECERVDLPEG